MFAILIEQILNGLLVGSYYIVLSLGMSLIFSLGGVVNLAHGAFYALGAYFAYSVQERLGFGGAVVLAGAGPAAAALLAGELSEQLAHGLGQGVVAAGRRAQDDAAAGLVGQGFRHGRIPASPGARAMGWHSAIWVYKHTHAARHGR